jgi:hypothetical protein
MLMYLWPFGIFYEHLEFLMPLWYILCSFGILYPVWVSCTEKNLATRIRSQSYDCEL